MPRTTLVGFILLAIAHAFPATAQPPDASLSLEQLEQWALENHPSLRQAYGQVQEARGSWVQVGLYPNPSVGYQAEEIGDSGSAGIQGGFVGQQIVTANKLDWNRAVASWDIQQACLQLEVQQLRVRTGIRTAYYRALGAQQTVQIAQQLVQILQQGVETAEALLQAEQAPRTDLLQAEIELAGMQVLLQTAQQHEQAARRQLAAAVGLDELPPGPLEGSLQGELPEFTWDAQWERLLQLSPIFGIARVQIERARAQLVREQLQPIPDLNLRSSVSHDFAGDQTLVGAEVAIALPVHNRNQGNIAAALARLRQALSNQERLELSQRDELAAALRRYGAARAQVQLYRDSILPKSQENLDLTAQGYRLGELDFLRVLTARRTYAENQINYLSALTELRMAAAAIDGLLMTDGLTSPAQLPNGFTQSSANSSSTPDPTLPSLQTR